MIGNKIKEKFVPLFICQGIIIIVYSLNLKEC